MRRSFLLMASLLAASTAMGAKPNILFIFTDDHAYQAIGAYGGILKPHVKTPNIDRLAKEGMRFDRCYTVNSICGPMRAAILTGK
ncbi:MAG: sulfatase-like hydrolase/transferase, partial [Verrucomicrobiota bacterium]